MTILDTKIYW